MEIKKTDLNGNEALRTHDLTVNNGYEPSYIPFTQLEIPKPIANIGHYFDEKTEQARAYALKNTPAPIVNLNSQINGIAHVAAEISMFKASGVKFLHPRSGKQVNYLTDPPRNLWRAIRGVDKAAHLQNDWSTRATMAGFAGWSYSSVMPEKTNNAEDIEKYAELAQASPIKYAGTKLYEGVNVLNPEFTRESIGLGVMLAGAFSFISAFQNINLKTGARFTNPTHAIGGAITAMAGSSLLFGRSDKEGWKNFGHLINLRLPFAIMSIHKKYKGNDRWGSYALGQLLFQGAAVYSSLYGGAEKLPDGTVIDQDVGETIKLHDKKAASHDVKPENKVSDVHTQAKLKEAAPDMAMASS